MRDSWLHGNALAKEAKGISIIGPKPNNERKKERALKTRCKQPHKNGASEEVLE